MINSITEVRPSWGHPLETPEGKEIRVPKWVFPRLRQLGLLEKNRARLLPAVWLFLQPQFDSLTEGLRLLLGPDLSGPDWCRCNCRECQSLVDVDDSRLSRVRSSQIVADVKKRRPRALVR
jgi:hypothetical protein